MSNSPNASHQNSASLVAFFILTLSIYSIMQPNLNEFITLYTISEVLNHIKENILPEIEKSAKVENSKFELLNQQIKDIEVTMKDIVKNYNLKQKLNFNDIEKEGGETVIRKSSKNFLISSNSGD